MGSRTNVRPNIRDSGACTAVPSWDVAKQLAVPLVARWTEHARRKRFWQQFSPKVSDVNGDKAPSRTQSAGPPTPFEVGRYPTDLAVGRIQS
jgi:hypothetical protein